MTSSIADNDFSMVLVACEKAPCIILEASDAWKSVERTYDCSCTYSFMVHRYRGSEVECENDRGHINCFVGFRPCLFEDMEIRLLSNPRMYFAFQAE